MKKNIQKMKEDIKVMVLHQKECKRNRKTIYLKGVRIMEPWEATYKVPINKLKLELYYIAYAKLRGKDPITCSPNYKKRISEKRIDQILEKYPFPNEDKFMKLIKKLVA